MEPKDDAATTSRKLTAEKARQIRIEYADGASILDLAKRFGVTDSTIWNVVNYETWVSAGPENPANRRT